MSTGHWTYDKGQSKGNGKNKGKDNDIADDETTASLRMRHKKDTQGREQRQGRIFDEPPPPFPPTPPPPDRKLDDDELLPVPPPPSDHLKSDCICNELPPYSKLGPQPEPSEPELPKPEESADSSLNSWTKPEVSADSSLNSWTVIGSQNSDFNTLGSQSTL